MNKRRPPHWRQLLLRALRIAGIAAGSVLAVVIVIVAALWIWAGDAKTPPSQIKWGVTFSTLAARGLGLDPHAAYLAILDDLHPQLLRLGAYWTLIEPTNGKFDDSDLDFQVAEAEQRGIPYVIAVGRKVPRWPECFVPGWAKSLPTSQQDDRLLSEMTHVIQRYDSGSHLLRWQIENEPYFQFGNCPGVDEPFLKREVALARSLSRRPIMMTDSGEGSDWLSASALPDVFGSTLYRVVLNPKGNPFHQLLWPEYYTRHANLIKKIHPNIKDFVIAELQAEPWTAIGITGIPQSYIDLTLSHKQFQDNIDFARQVGPEEVYMWGAEWWYYRKLHGDDYYWKGARATFAAHSVR